MKTSKFIVKLAFDVMNGKKHKFQIPSSQYAKLDIPYTDKDDDHLKFDLFYAKEGIRKDILLLDIHGGGYVGGTRKGNHQYASYWLNKGYDVALADYRNEIFPITIEDQVNDLKTWVKYLYQHREELSLSPKDVYLTGDSAGGQFALLLGEWLQKEEIPFFPLSGILLNCPVYDFATMVKGASLTNKAKIYLFGKEYANEKRNLSLSPRQHIQENHVPLFFSSSTYDFLKPMAEFFKEDEPTFSFSYQFLFLETKNKKAGHVHNVTSLDLEESKEVNEAMDAFMMKYSQKED